MANLLIFSTRVLSATTTCVTVCECNSVELEIFSQAIIKGAYFSSVLQPFYELYMNFGNEFFYRAFGVEYFSSEVIL